MASGSAVMTASQVVLSDQRTSMEQLDTMKSEEDGVDEDTKRRHSLERTLWTRIWQGLAFASIVVNIVAMAIEQSAVSIVAGIIAVLIAPVVIKRQFDLQDTASLRDVQNQLRKDVNALQVENNKLSASNTRLETQVIRLKEKEAKLDVITKEQGSNVDSFVKLVKENRETLESFKRSIRTDTINDLVQALLQSDFDRSATFSDNEIENDLEISLMLVPGITVNHQLLVKRIKATDRDMASVLALLQEIDRDDLADEERIFRVDIDERKKQSLEKAQ